jgi:hypothetical protein
MNLKHLRIVSVFAAIICGNPALGREKVLYLDKNSRAPVARIAIGTALYAYEYLNSNAPNHHEVIDHEVIMVVTQRLSSLGYVVSDWTDGKWDQSDWSAPQK